MPWKKAEDDSSVAPVEKKTDSEEFDSPTTKTTYPGPRNSSTFKTELETLNRLRIRSSLPPPLPRKEG
ncbi:hypothetical protein PF011_g816 [Phytophthora fragariae]|uniref:Uncharacterized protein n=1 Tax=Phytophthora fragariae TaxID=53985 RepID=A0A6A3MKT2_9STRA|nr:hypothetical protein PF011_g816 [Phytophthora fragariae]KAE9356594.1 hypothetical protein PF008_g3541 [Phytophthora fragariae]